MKPKLTEKGITYKTISRVGNILLVIFVFFNACALACAQKPAAVAAVAKTADSSKQQAGGRSRAGGSVPIALRAGQRIIGRR